MHISLDGSIYELASRKNLSVAFWEKALVLLTLNNTSGKNLSNKFLRSKVGYNHSRYTMPFVMYQMEERDFSLVLINARIVFSNSVHLPYGAF